MSQGDRVDLVVEALERQLPALDYAAKGVAARLVRLGTLFTDAIERVASTFGLSSNEYVILCVLRASGPPYALPPKSITPLMALSSGGMTNILHALAARGLIERRPDPSDRRGVIIQISPEAIKLVNQAIAAHVAEEQRMVASLAPAERQALQKLLRKLLLHVDPVPEPVRTATRLRPAARATPPASGRRRY